MARTFKIYKKDGTKVVESASPLTIPNLTAAQSYPAGEFLISAVEDGVESNKVNVPAFTTKPVAVTGVTIKGGGNVETIVGGTAEFEIQVAPANATNKGFTVKGDNDTVATFSIVGNKVQVDAKAVGEANYTVTTNDGGKTATGKVTVQAAG